MVAFFAASAFANFLLITQVTELLKFERSGWVKTLKLGSQFERTTNLVERELHLHTNIAMPTKGIIKRR